MGTLFGHRELAMNGFRKLLASATLFVPMLAFGLDVSAQSAIVMDASTGKVLWSKDAETQRYPASTTKIMTGLLLLEHCPLTEIITAPADVEKVKESSMHLKPYEKVSVLDMLYAVMLRSANDGCYAVACHIAGSVPKFAQMMNDRAKQLGCTNTHFDNPNGLNDPEHKTTAHDLALIAREAMKNPVFRDVVRTYRHEITRSIDQKDRMMVNHNKWLAKDETADGIKTGYTVPAGHCYVGSVTRNGYRIITVVMKSQHWQDDHKTLLHWAYENHNRCPILQRDTIVATSQVSGGAKSQVAVGPATDVETILSKAKWLSGETHAVTRTVLKEPISAPVRRGQTVGTLFVRDSEGFEQAVPLVAEEDVNSGGLFSRSSNGKGGGGAIWIGGALLAGTFFVRGRARRLGFNAKTNKSRFL